MDYKYYVDQTLPGILAMNGIEFLDNQTERVQTRRRVMIFLNHHPIPTLYQFTQDRKNQILSDLFC